MRILGISAFYHDSAAAIIENGRIIAAAEEERFSRKKHDNGFPHGAIAFCLRAAGISIAAVDKVAYYEKPLRKFERILEIFASTYPRGLESFVSTMPEWLSEKIQVEQIIRDRLQFRGEILYVPHHLSHAAMAFYPSPFQRAAILTVDGVGEYETTALWIGDGTKLTQLASIHFPHSLGLLYSTVTAFLGFKVNNDEYKVMGLAGFGTPSLFKQLSKVVLIHDDGSFELNMRYFSFPESTRMWGDAFEKLFGQPRTPGSAVSDRDRDLAASLQALTEKIYFRLLKKLFERTKETQVCVGGGVALNATANGKLFFETPFIDAYIPGVAGDSGAALGAALFAFHSIHGGKRIQMRSLDYGPHYTDQEIGSEIRKYSIDSILCKNTDELCDRVAKLLEAGAIVGWFQGRMEFGPRALGNRSILADPRRRDIRERINRIKNREHFHPCAAAVLAESVQKYFEIPTSPTSGAEYPFMTFCFPAKNFAHKKIPAIVHVDGTCRIQTVSTDQPLFYRLISAFALRSGESCLLNTSFNRRGEPIVENPRQAIEDFLTMQLDHLAIGNFILSRKQSV